MRELGRALLLVLLGVLLLGFGLCGAAGVVGGAVTLFQGRGDLVGALLFVVPGLIGLLIAAGAWGSITALRRKPRSGP